MIPLEGAVRWVPRLPGGGELLTAPETNAVGAALTSCKVEVAGQATRQVDA